jgi:hypothetical protein
VACQRGVEEDSQPDKAAWGRASRPARRLRTLRDGPMPRWCGSYAVSHGALQGQAQRQAKVRLTGSSSAVAWVGADTGRERGFSPGW